eukprot:CAMPEP_0196586706 /NCGR_PEP_ID=MMETSP1081-20130531/55295_1 /TAXON_ID=36882 /ORGANISM="Pyramimonas amylifera, Strain CCMP720" /LENGTH=234 /DNA_ID=CAMNT_0041908677 /DNA_START=121 /DNA_END=822 /DNA_ORIENTATION=+
MSMLLDTSMQVNTSHFGQSFGFKRQFSKTSFLKPKQARYKSKLLIKLSEASQVASSIASTGNGTEVKTSGLSRRSTILGIGLSSLALIYGSEASMATPLAPLGKVGVATGGPKLEVPIEKVKDILEDDLAVGQYFITGNLTKEIFADDCRFKDPTNDIVGLARYVKALGILFDPDNSSVELRSIEVVGDRTIQATWTLGGTLKLPWKPVIDRIQGQTIYTLNESGLIQVQEQVW